RPRLGFVRVHAQIVGLLLLLRHERPLEPRGEAGPPAAPQPRLLHDVGDPDGLHGARLLERGVPAPLHPPLVRAGVGLAEVSGEEHRLAGVRLVRVAHLRPSPTPPNAECGMPNAECIGPMSNRTLGSEDRTYACNYAFRYLH